VHSGKHRYRKHGSHRDWQIVQAVVVYNVEIASAATGELQHQCQVRVVVCHERLRGHGYVCPRGSRHSQGANRQGVTVQIRVRSRRGENGYLVAASGERTGQMPNVSFQPAGKGLADRKAAGRDQRDTKHGIHVSKLW
jgi:hypothetical protein